MRVLVLLIFGTIAVFAGGLALRLGVLKDVRVTEAEEGPYRQVYAKHTGAYHKIVGVLDKAEAWAEDNGEKCELSFGEFLDDPQTVDEDRLRSVAGCIVEKDWSQETLPEGFFYREVPRKKYVIALFDGAPSISPYKVYPKALAYIGEKKMKIAGPITEIYRIIIDNAVETKYLFPVKPIRTSPREGG